MKTTNLGDSGYVIYSASRSEEADNKDSIILTKTFRSEEQQYRFNFPYQCGTSCELPYKAFDNEHEVHPGKDFVVMGTDGLFDNLYDADIEKCLLPSVKAVKDKEDQFELMEPAKAADCMAKRAYNLSKDPNYKSPFSVGAAQSGKLYRGGKEDDITVIVSQIIRKE